MLHHPRDVEAECVVVGDMADAEFVRHAVDSADGVVHCAALKAPMMGPTEAVLCGKTTGTFTVLEHTRDAARACVLGLTEPPAGCHVVTVRAPNRVALCPAEQLLAAYHPHVPRRRAFPGRAAPFDLNRSRDLLHFTAAHLQEIEEREFKPGKVGVIANG